MSFLYEDIIVTIPLSILHLHRDVPGGVNETDGLNVPVPWSVSLVDPSLKTTRPHHDHLTTRLRSTISTSDEPRTGR